MLEQMDKPLATVDVVLREKTVQNVCSVIAIFVFYSKISNCRQIYQHHILVIFLA